MSSVADLYLDSTTLSLFRSSSQQILSILCYTSQSKVHEFCLYVFTSDVY